MKKIIYIFECAINVYVQKKKLKEIIIIIVY